MLFAHAGVSSLHALQESQLRVKGDALRNIRPLDAIVDAVGGLHGGEVVCIAGVGDSVQKGGLAATVRAGNTQMLGAAEN